MGLELHRSESSENKKSLPESSSKKLGKFDEIEWDKISSSNRKKYYELFKKLPEVTPHSINEHIRDTLVDEKRVLATKRRARGLLESSKDRKRIKDTNSNYRFLNHSKLQKSIVTMREDNCHLFVVSGRGPMEYQLQDQELIQKPGPGGVATALASFQNYLKGCDMPATFISTPKSEGDQIVMCKNPQDRAAILQKDSLEYVSMNEAIDKEFNGFCNGNMWFVVHGMEKINPEIEKRFNAYCKENEESTRGLEHNIKEESLQEKRQEIKEKVMNEVERSFELYCQGNEAFMKNIGEAIKKQKEKDPNKKPVVMLNDYHLLMAAGMLRKQHPDIIIQTFMHTAWSGPEYFEAWPRHIVEKILVDGMSGNHISGFQTKAFADNYMKCVQKYVPDAKIDFSERTIRWPEHQTSEQRETQIRVYPISPDIDKIREADNRVSSDPEVKEMEKLLDKLEKGNIKIIGRVDRMDPIKNIINPLNAYCKLLEQDDRNNPKWIEKVSFVHCLQPTRSNEPEYQKYCEDIEKLITKINAQYGTPDWQPIHVFKGHNQERADMLMDRCHILLVPSEIDGMNLVVKEFAARTKNNGVAILSEKTGAFPQMKNGVIGLSEPNNPTKIEEAMKNAMGMSPEERKGMAANALEVVERQDLLFYYANQIDDLNKVRRPGLLQKSYMEDHLELR